ncbi:MAG: hypothetical protein WCD69_15420, partial [Xanthobacteraceae bacterium]
MLSSTKLDNVVFQWGRHRLFHASFWVRHFGRFPLVDCRPGKTLLFGAFGLVHCQRGRTFDVLFDFTHHRLHIETSYPKRWCFGRWGLPISSRIYASDARASIDVHIWTMPSEIVNA